MQSFYQHYYKKYIQALQNVADKADRQRLEIRVTDGEFGLFFYEVDRVLYSSVVYPHNSDLGREKIRRLLLNFGSNGCSAQEGLLFFEEVL
ncbi:uncharacterized protein LOC110735118 isoform X3 [Chenopodium quinoa]|uniref:uncharacterized protein LOC110735118 isoform X3 n=1 Tax=Chenopodium quinoa TaxID=63459 RepID=UPI000B794758|nr:uncharacterized protein LOC110735118 isoform X3 [Chenopodium quinoa]